MAVTEEILCVIPYCQRNFLIKNRYVVFVLFDVLIHYEYISYKERKHMEIIEVTDRTQELIGQLLDIWENSVKETHLFLSEAEIAEIRKYVPQALAGVPHLLVARDEANAPIAFMGIDNQMLEMLFVSPQNRGRGVGKKLVQYAIKEYAVNELTVNEQNPQAIGFYEHIGFRVYRKTDTDEQGKPYPLLYMKWYPDLEAVRKKKKKTVTAVFIIGALVVMGVAAAAVILISLFTEKNVVTDVGEYEKYFGPQGIHRSNSTEAWEETRESYLVLNDIFPEKLPDSAEVEDFYYEYFNPWDPCYLCYLVYSCDEEDYKAETDRLKQIKMPEDYLIYGSTGFPYPPLAVNAGRNGYIYAMAEDVQNKIIYVELTFHNFFTDIDYERVIPKEYLPIGFDAKTDNPYREEYRSEL